MAEGDEDKTTFFAGEGIFCYRKMPFGLKNAGATYQILVDKVFHDQIGRNLEAYVDDMVIKSTFKEQMSADIKETFEKFRSINMKLNPKKCSFGVEEGPFLGHLITKHKTITDVEQLKTLKDVQSLNGKIEALRYFNRRERDPVGISYLEELHVTWAHFENKRTRLRTYTDITQDNVLSSWRRHHQYNVTLGFAAALAVLVTGASQSRQHESHHRFFPVDTSLIHIESRKSPTKSLFDVGSRRISIFTVNTKEYHSDVLAIITRIMRRT
ncbi:reverse transcriptase domain-containing protein [Tanacetum coccineum]